MLQRFLFLLIVISSFIFTGCLTSAKMDKYVAGQFGNQLPRPDKRTDSAIIVTSSIPSDPEVISDTKKKSKSLPLIIYWEYDYRHTTVLNPAIGINNFRKTIYQQAGKLKQKLDGKKLELKIEQIPASFAIVDKGTILLLVIHWYKLYVESDSKPLIVSYRVLQNGTESGSGKITINNITSNRGIRFFKGWRSSAADFLAQYNVDMAEMAKMVVNKLLQEL